MQSGGGRVRFGWGHHDLLDVIGGDSGRGCVAPNHALVHLHQVVLLLLLHSKTTTAAKSLPSPACSSLHAAAAVSSPALLSSRRLAKRWRLERGVSPGVLAEMGAGGFWGQAGRLPSSLFLCCAFGSLL